ncbi:MAG: hypothetical protein LBF93_00465, partial [Zoogloeaceae bacterium]|nr:hypothetical protein [Zoogloeaceae bacterium]
RETFVPFAILGLVSVFIAQGKRAAFRFFMGGVVTGILLICGILVARGGISDIIASYRAAGIVFGAVSSELRLEHFISYGRAAADSSLILLIFGVLAIMVLSSAIFLRRDKSLFLATIFWLSFIVVALTEAVTKISYAYHFAIAFPGLAGLCALALREIIRTWPAMKLTRINHILAMAGIVLSAAWLYFSSSALATVYWPMTLEAWVVAPSGEWPEKFTKRSHYLLVAAEIKKVIPENGTLGINRNAHALYPLTGYLPPVYRLNDLSTTAILLNFSVPVIRQALLDCAPDVLAITTLNDWPTGGGSAYLLEAVLATGIYEAIAKIPSGKQGRGHFDGVIIFRKTKETVCLVK